MTRRKRSPLVTFTRRGLDRRSPNDHLWVGHDERPDPNRPVNHAAALEDTTWLAEVFFSMNKPTAARVRPADLIAVLNKVKVRFVLMGVHGIAGWMHQPRGTRDVDVVVGKRDFKRAGDAVQKSWPTLIRDEQRNATCFCDPIDREVVVDLIRPIGVYSQALKNSVWVDAYRVPKLELALAAKFTGMSSLERDICRRLLDMADFIGIVKRNYPRIDHDRLESLGELVYVEGGKHLLECVEDAQADRNLRV